MAVLVNKKIPNTNCFRQKILGIKFKFDDGLLLFTVADLIYSKKCIFNLFKRGATICALQTYISIILIFVKGFYSLANVCATKERKVYKPKSESKPKCTSRCTKQKISIRPSSRGIHS